VFPECSHSANGAQETIQAVFSGGKKYQKELKNNLFANFFLYVLEKKMFGKKSSVF